MPVFSQMDPQKIFLIVVVAAVGLIVSIPVINLLSRIRRSYSIRLAQKQALMQRNSQAQKQVFVRQTDIESNLSREDRVRFAEAESLAASGRIQDAARIFESIRFQRKAIDLLEQHGFIDEACNVLVRLKVPARAAVVYERNNMLDKAAHFYQSANNLEKAAECYMKLGQRDFRFLAKAADACRKTGDLRGEIKAELMAMQTAAAVQKCFEHEHYDLLIELLRDPIVAGGVFRDMDEADRKTLIEHVPLVPQNIQMMAGWLWIFPDYQLSALLLEAIADEAGLSPYFWTVVPAGLREFLLQLMNKQARLLSHKLLTAHATAMRQAGYEADADSLDEVIAAKDGPATSLTETEPPRAVPFPLPPKVSKVS